MRRRNVAKWLGCGQHIAWLIRMPIMERTSSYREKGLGSLIHRRYNIRPLLLRFAWAVNILLFATVFWALVFCFYSVG
jgi:hypothetical protein